MLDREGVPAARCRDRRGYAHGFVFADGPWREDNDARFHDHTYLLDGGVFRQLFPEADVNRLLSAAAAVS